MKNITPVLTAICLFLAASVASAAAPAANFQLILPIGTHTDTKIFDGLQRDLTFTLSCMRTAGEERPGLGMKVDTGSRRQYSEAFPDGLRKVVRVSNIKPVFGQISVTAARAVGDRGRATEVVDCHLSSTH